MSNPTIPEGYTPWHGGECPEEAANATSGTSVLLEDGTILHAAHARVLQWNDAGKPKHLRIIAYRVEQADHIGDANKMVDHSPDAGKMGEAKAWACICGAPLPCQVCTRRAGAKAWADDDARLYAMFRALVDAGGPETLQRHGAVGVKEFAQRVRAGMLVIERKHHPERFDDAPPGGKPAPGGGGVDECALAREIAEAVAADEAGEGCDISAGLFGPSLSAIIRRLAAPAPAGEAVAYDVRCVHETTNTEAGIYFVEIKTDNPPKPGTKLYPGPTGAGGEAIKWTEENSRVFAMASGWYVRESASVPTADGEWRNPFEVTIPSRDLCEMLNRRLVRAEGGA